MAYGVGVVRDGDALSGFAMTIEVVLQPGTSEVLVSTSVLGDEAALVAVESATHAAAEAGNWHHGSYDYHIHIDGPEALVAGPSIGAAVAAATLDAWSRQTTGTSLWPIGPPAATGIVYPDGSLGRVAGLDEKAHAAAEAGASAFFYPGRQEGPGNVGCGQDMPCVALSHVGGLLPDHTLQHPDPPVALNTTPMQLYEHAHRGAVHAIAGVEAAASARASGARDALTQAEHAWASGDEQAWLLAVQAQAEAWLFLHRDEPFTGEDAQRAEAWMRERLAATASGGALLADAPAEAAPGDRVRHAWIVGLAGRALSATAQVDAGGAPSVSRDAPGLGAVVVLALGIGGVWTHWRGGARPCTYSRSHVCNVSSPSPAWALA